MRTAVMLGLALTLAGLAAQAAPLASADSSGVTLTVSPAQDPLSQVASLTANTTLARSSIASIDFEYEAADTPAAAQNWTSLGLAGVSTFSTQLATASLPDGLYDLRVELTPTDGPVQDSPVLRDQLIANDSPVVKLTGQPTFSSGSALHQTVVLRAQALASSFPLPGIAGVSFQISPADDEQWQTLASPSFPGSPLPGESFHFATGSEVDYAFDTTTVPDGVYDLRVVPTDDTGVSYATIPVRGVIIDNTPPVVSLQDPGSSLTGTVTLSVAASDATSGVAFVEYERAVAGTGAWTPIGTASNAPFSLPCDTTYWNDGSYDLRAIATDKAGNVAISNVVTDTASNPPPPPAPAPPTIQGVDVGAQDVTILGSVTGSSDGETWAYGYTTAPPANVDGQPLPYTAQGDQFVLLRYTDDTGWGIADVLRNPDGTPFQLLPASETGADPVQVSGSMTASGEAWLSVYEQSSDGSQSVSGLFHRLPGGPFVYDAAATAAVGAGLLNGSTQLRLSQTGGGQVYGVLTSSAQTATATSVAGTAIDEGLQYALLDDGSWTLHTAQLPSSYAPLSGDTVALDFADVSGPDAGWAELSLTRNKASSLFLGSFVVDPTGVDPDAWTYVSTGLDALDGTAQVGNAQMSITPTGLKFEPPGAAAPDGALWIGASDALPGATPNPVVARYDIATGAVTNSWCSLPVATSCAGPIDPPEYPAAVPDAVFDSPSGTIAYSLQQGGGEDYLDVFSRGTWTSTPAVGYPPSLGDTPSGGDSFSGPGAGWLGGQTLGQDYPDVVGQVSSQPSSLLTAWPIADRSPLTGVALPPGSDAGVDESGALAVGLSGTALLYSAGVGWLVQPLPPQAQHLNLTSVAFSGPSSAFAVGQYGVILDWNGTSWSEDPQSSSLTQVQLNSVAFGPSGQGWAVGDYGTILHYAGQTWSVEQPPAAVQLSGDDITSVAVAGSYVYAIAGGDLIVRDPDGTWVSADPSLLPSDPAPAAGSLRLVAGLADGGAVVAGVSAVLASQSAGAPFAYSDQPTLGVPVALAAFRDGDGVVRAAVSIAPPAPDPFDVSVLTEDLGYPPGDGELEIETAGGWLDLSRAQPAGSPPLGGDGVVQPDPVLAIAMSPDGQHAWAVGGYDGTPAANGQGTTTIQPARPTGWQTASLWRYDAGGSAAAPPALSTTSPQLPATPGTVSFAFFTSPICISQCAATVQAQPDVNLAGAVSEINAYAAQPGGPAFAMLGGDAVGPSDTTARAAGNGAADFALLPSLLAPLQLPLFGAYGDLDSVPGEQDPTQPWSQVFEGAPAPMGDGGTVPGITPVSSSAAAGAVSRYYSFDASQNGATLRIIVLDNSLGSLEGSEPGQTAWLDQQLAAAAGLPTVVVTALPLYGSATSDGASVAAQLVSAGVLAVFTMNGPGTNAQLDEVHQVPQGAAETIPEYEGATLGYQQSQNDGVTWYEVSVNASQHAVAVNAVPVVQSLTLEPLGGLTVPRSLTLQFQAIARRPPGSLPDSVYNTFTAGFDNYVEIPASTCSGCITPTYAFSSSNPSIADFVTPSGPGSPYPALDANGHPIHNSQSGLLCAYNAGTVNVSITTGLLTYSLPVTVQPGGFGAPCGTTTLTGVTTATTTKLPSVTAPAAVGAGAAVPPPPPPAAAAAVVSNVSPKLTLPAPPPPQPAPHHAPPPAPAPAAPQPQAHVARPVRPLPKPVPRPAPVVRPAPQPVPRPTPRPAPAPLVVAPVLNTAPAFSTAAAIVPPPATPAQPIPPGGAVAPSVSQSPAAAERREKARKHASQHAFSTLTPAGSDGAAWWYWGMLGSAGLLAMVLVGQGVRPRGAAARCHVQRR